MNPDLQNLKWLYKSLSYTPFYIDFLKSFNSNGELYKQHVVKKYLVWILCECKRAITKIIWIFINLYKQKMMERINSSVLLLHFKMKCELYLSLEFWNRRLAHNVCWNIACHFVFDYLTLEKFGIYTVWEW